ncbi:hypothetical protein ACQEU3_47015 [Spirillospora sp. CA-253888]
MTSDFVQRLTARRTELGIAQRRLAERMVGAGFDWHHSTVARTEHGERHLRLDEAQALAQILAMPLTTSDEAAAAFSRAQQEITDLRRANTDLADRLRQTEARLAEQTDARQRAENTITAIKTALDTLLGGKR